MNDLNISFRNSPLRWLFRALLFNIYRVIIIFIFFIGLGLYVHKNTEDVYRVKSLIQVDTQSSRSGDYMEMLFSAGSDINLDEQINIYKSRSNMVQLVKELKLNLYVDDEAYNEFIKHSPPFFIDNFDMSLGYRENYALFVLSVDNLKATLRDSAGNIILENFEFNKDYEEKGIKFKITNNLIAFEDVKEFQIVYENLKSTVASYEDSINLTKFESRFNYFRGSLLEVSILSNDPETAVDILNKSNDIFLNQSLSMNTEDARKSLDYLEKQIENVSLRLQESENELNAFRVDNVSIDIEAESLSYLEQLNNVQTKLEQLYLKRVEYQSLYSENNPLSQTLENQVNELNSQREDIEREIRALPSQQQTLINLTRQVAVNQKIFEDLLASKSQFSLLEASTIGNVRIIDKAFIDAIVAPVLTSILLFSLFFAALISFIYIVVRQRFFYKLQVPTDLVTENRKLIGVIPFLDENITKIDELETNDAFQSALTNISALLFPTNDENNKSKTMLMCGPTMGIGKSTMCFLTALGQSQRGKKVVLIDLDYRRGDIHKLVSTERQKYGYMLEENFDISKCKVNENFYAITKPMKYSQKQTAISLIESVKFQRFLERLKDQFDLIVFDAPPVLSMSEGVLLSTLSDINIGIVSHNESTLRDVENMEAEMEIVDQQINYFIYNKFKKPRGYYGYDYYSYKYYSYNSDYDYTPKED